MLPMTFRTQKSKKGLIPKEAFCEPESDKIDNRGPTLIIIVDDYYILTCMSVSFLLFCRFSCSLFLPQKQAYSGPIDF